MKYMVRILALLLCVVCLFCACGAPSSQVPQVQAPSVIEGGGAAEGQIAFLVLEEEYPGEEAAALWGAISQFGGEEGVQCALYPTSADGAEATLGLAIKGGAKMVVTMGPQMAQLALEQKSSYPGVHFVLVGAEEGRLPGSGAVTVRLAAEQAGWLAGYTSVYEGARKLAYLDEEQQEAQRYGLGFLLGANAAAKELKLEAGEEGVQVLPLVPKEDNEAGWRRAISDVAKEGAEVIFVNDKQLQEVAERGVAGTECRVIGLQLGAAEEGLPDALLCSVQLGVHKQVTEVLGRWKSGSFPTGQQWLAGVHSGDISIDLAAANLRHFNESDYKRAQAHFVNAQFEEKLQEQTAPNPEGAMPRPQDLEAGHVQLLPGGGEPTSSSVPGPGEG